jgi:repressor LexA
VKAITDRQREVLAFLARFAHERGRLPVWSEVMAGCAFRSKQAVSTHFRALARKGWMTYGAGTANGRDCYSVRGLEMVPRYTPDAAGERLRGLLEDAPHVELRGLLEDAPCP